MTFKELRREMSAPVSPVPLAVFRIVFGLAMLWTVVNFFKDDRIGQTLTDASFHLTFYGFGWVHPLGEFGMQLLFWALGVFAALIALGLFTRPAALLFGIGFGYVLLIDKTNFVNHHYLFALLSLLLAWTPSGAALSLDALFRGRRGGAARWHLAILGFQIAAVYTFAGLAKIDVDWLSRGLGSYLAASPDFPLIGGALRGKTATSLMAWGGMFFDLLVVPALLSKRTRWFALAVAAAFHVTNSLLFTIGMFPWVMITGTFCFFFSDVLAKRFLVAQVPVAPKPLSPLAGSLLAAYAMVQVVLPLRHLAYPGDVDWTGEGGTFAWRMMLDEKYAYARFFVHDPEKDLRWEVTGSNYLTDRQQRLIARDPDMVLQFAHHLAEEWRTEGFPGVEVHTEAFASMTGKGFMPMISPDVDLAAVPRRFGHAAWILPKPPLTYGR